MKRALSTAATAVTLGLALTFSSSAFAQEDVDELVQTQEIERLDLLVKEDEDLRWFFAQMNDIATSGATDAAEIMLTLPSLNKSHVGYTTIIAHTYATAALEDQQSPELLQILLNEMIDDERAMTIALSQILRIGYETKWIMPADFTGAELLVKNGAKIEHTDNVHYKEFMTNDIEQQERRVRFEENQLQALLRQRERYLEFEAAVTAASPVTATPPTP